MKSLYIKKDILSDFEYFIALMNQYNNMIHEKDPFRIDFIMNNFFSFKSNFQNILLTIGFKEEEIIHDKKKVNNLDHDEYSKVILTQNLLDKVNEICKEDFEKFHYIKIEKIEDLI